MAVAGLVVEYDSCLYMGIPSWYEGRDFRRHSVVSVVSRVYQQFNISPMPDLHRACEPGPEPAPGDRLIDREMC